MVYQIVINHEDGVTLKDIAAAEGIDFSRGLGFYQLTKKEKVSAGKNLVLWSQGKAVSDNTADVLTRCGLRPNADNNIQPKDIPAGHLLFVQSTSANRKISEDAAALFVVDSDDGKAASQNEGKEEEEEEVVKKPVAKKAVKSKAGTKATKKSKVKHDDDEEEDEPEGDNPVMRSEEDNLIFMMNSNPRAKLLPGPLADKLGHLWPGRVVGLEGISAQSSLEPAVLSNLVPHQPVNVPEAKEGEEDDEDEESAPRKRKSAKAPSKKASNTSSSAKNEGGKHTYKVVDEHEDGATLKEIAAEAGINHLLAFYQLTKKEKVSAGKKLALMKDGKLVSDDSAEVLQRCGLPAGKDNNIEPKHVPKGHQLFVQSTSPNRKISEDTSAAFYVISNEEDEDEDEGNDKKEDEEGEENEDEGDEGEPSKKKSKGSDVEWAISFDNDVISELLNAEDEPDEVDIDAVLGSFKHPIGTSFSGCDELVPAEAQSAALSNLSLLFTADWDTDSISIQTSVNPYTQGKYIKRASAVGSVKHYCLAQGNGYTYSSYTTEPVRIEFTGIGPTFVCSFGKRWSAMIGSAGGHPFVYCNEIAYDNSDGSSSQVDLLDLPKGASQIDRLNAIIAYNIKWFVAHCGNCEH